MKVAVLASPRSGANRRRPRRLARLADTARAHGFDFHAPDSLDALAAALDAVAASPPDVLVLNGGDGTLHRSLSAAVPRLDPLPALALLPGGTMDIAARSTGWNGRGAGLLDRLAAADPAALPTTERSLLRIDGRWYGFLFGNGLLARFLETYEARPDPNAARAAAILGRAAASALVRGPYAARLTRRWRGRVTIDGQPLPRQDWLAVAAGTVEQIGLGFRPFRLAAPGRMHAVALGGAAHRFARELPRVYRRKPLTDPDNLERAASRLELESDEPIGYMVDGDLHRADGALVVALGPTARFVVPSPGAC